MENRGLSGFPPTWLHYESIMKEHPTWESPSESMNW